MTRVVRRVATLCQSAAGVAGNAVQGGNAGVELACVHVCQAEQLVDNLQRWMCRPRQLHGDVVAALSQRQSLVMWHLGHQVSVGRMVTCLPGSPLSHSKTVSSISPFSGPVTSSMQPCVGDLILTDTRRTKSRS